MLNKKESYKFFTDLDSFLKNKLFPQKTSIIEQVRKATPNGNELEGSFIKVFLAPLLKDYFSDKVAGLAIEGVVGTAQFKTIFFGSRPAPDFLFKNPILFNTVGEIKYCSLSPRQFALALGQLIIYMRGSKLEQNQADYGYMIFFNTSLNQDLAEPEQQFIKEIWGKENIFVTIL